VNVLMDTGGGPRAGIGHVLRSLALARRLRSLRMGVRLAAEPPDVPLVRRARRQAGVSVLSSARWRPNVVVVDRPDPSAPGLTALHRRWPSARLVALDYYGPSVPALAATVNLNAARKAAGDRRVQRSGLRYAIIRESFRAARRLTGRSRAGVRSVYVGFGGTDPHGWSLAAVRALTTVLPKGATIHLVVGQRPVEPMPAGARVRLHVAVGDPSRLLAASDFAVIGGGTMLIEAACVGVPAIVVPRTRLERIFSREFVDAGAAKLIPVGRAFPARGVAKQAAAILRTPATRRRMRAAGRRLVDGRGVARIAALVQAAGGAR